MANTDFQVIMHNVNNLAEDDYVNVLHFEVNAPDTVEGTADEIAAAYEFQWENAFCDYLDGMTIKAYVGAGAPIFDKDYPTFNPAAAPGPAEVALCLSYYADDVANNNGKRRGRIYLGPFAASGERPSAPVIAGVLDFGEALAQIGTAGNTTWKLDSSLGYLKIERIGCDNAWDTQRRRGTSPSSRTFRDVQ